MFMGAGDPSTQKPSGAFGTVRPQPAYLWEPSVAEGQKRKGGGGNTCGNQGVVPTTCGQQRGLSCAAPATWGGGTAANIVKEGSVHVPSCKTTKSGQQLLLCRHWHIVHESIVTIAAEEFCGGSSHSSCHCPEVLQCR